MSPANVNTRVVGGGSKKVLYTLDTVRRIGVLNSGKALRSKNACKACGLGMGGQLGGMTNEAGEFPSVCNKSIQAQSTDIQPAIPAQVFEHSIEHLAALSPHKLEHLGRLDTPLYRAESENHLRPVAWDWAIKHAAERFAACAPRNSFFYSSGRASNEAGFVLQLLARLYGTNNVSNCSFYCHEATGVALGNTIGTGTATVELQDLDGCDLVFLIGANPASNHPRLLHKLRSCRARGGQVIVINPAREAGLVRFAVPKSARSMLKGGDWIASEYLQPNVGSDIALFKALAKSILEMGAEDTGFIQAHTQGFAQWRADIDACDWDELSGACGLDRAQIDRVARMYAGSRNAVFAWGMGMTHHLHGVDNIEAIAALALLRGMVGRRFAGLLPLRGHSNVQGIGTIGVKPVLSADVFANIENEFGIKLPKARGLHTLAALEKAHAGKMGAALMMGGNLFAATPDREWTMQAFDRIGFKLYLTTTLNSGHVNGQGGGETLILPVAARDEEPQPTTQESMFNYVRMSDGGIVRLKNVRSETHVLADLAGHLLPDSPIDFQAFQQFQKVRQAIARTVPGMQDLTDIDVARREFTVRGRILHKPEFHTASGRAQFVICAVPSSRSDEAYPFTLMSLRSEGQFNSIIYEEKDSYRGVEHRWTVLMNPADLAVMSLQEGDRVDLESAWGRMSGVSVKAFDLPQGNLAVYYPEANRLTARSTDPRSHTPNFKSVAVRVVARLAKQSPASK